jgi:transcription elongation GreA/GreB family factor
MTISRTIQAHLAKADFAAVESDWLAQLGEAPNDLDFFVGVARALIGTAEEERARFLLGMLDEQLKEQKQWAVRLKLLERIGAILFPTPETLHPQIVTSLDKLYAGRPTYKGLKEAVGMTKATHDVPKTWEKVERLQNLLQFDVGSIVFMPGRGAGRVIEANLGLESFKIDFERFPGMSVGFKAAPKLLQPLPQGHILRRKIEEPKAVAALPPTELLKAILTSYGRPMGAGEIRDAVYGLVTESGWTSWWTAARKHQQVVSSGSGAKQTYHWAESSGDALDSVWRTFAKATPRKKIDLLRRDGARDPELRKRMAADLLKLGEAAADRDPGLAYEIWYSLERSGGVPDDLDWAPEALLADSADPVRLLSGVEDRLLRERGYTMLREYRDDWAGVYLGLLAQETDPRAIEVLIEGLAKGSPKDLDRFLDGLVSAPHRHPAAFVWLAERAASDEALRSRSPLRLLQQILGSLNRDEFASYRVRLVALAESGSTVPRLLTHLTEEQAVPAEDAVHRAAGLEPYQRDSLSNALELRFSSLRRENQNALYATQEKMEEKRAELKQIMSIDIPANRKAIEEARAMGDLRENFEYKSARQRHEYLNARASALNSELLRVRLIEIEGTDLSEVRIGTRVRLEGPARQRTIIILGPWESQPEDDILSYESEIAKQVLGRSLGDEIELAGHRYRIAAIEPYK